MFIKKIMRKDGVTVVVYEDNGSVFTIKTAEEPKASLLAALLNLRQPLLRNLGIPLQESIAKDYKDISFEPQKRSAAKLEREQVANLFDVCGLVHSLSEKNGESFRILGILSGNTLKTSGMKIPAQGDLFWEGKEPTEQIEVLTPEDMVNIRTLLTEAESFVDGAREQGQLFDTEGNPTEDADNEEDQEAF